jgi:hypothetical protein
MEKLNLSAATCPITVVAWVLFATAHCFGGQASIQTVVVHVRPEARLDVHTQGDGIILVNLTVRLNPGTTVEVLLEDELEPAAGAVAEPEQVLRTSQSGRYSVPIRRPAGIGPTRITRLKVSSSDHSLDSIVTLASSD